MANSFTVLMASHSVRCRPKLSPRTVNIQCHLQQDHTAASPTIDLSKVESARKQSLIHPFFLHRSQGNPLMQDQMVAEGQQLRKICAYLLSLQPAVLKPIPTILQGQRLLQLLVCAHLKKGYLQCQELPHPGHLLETARILWL
jgi:hypothetical protein